MSFKELIVEKKTINESETFLGKVKDSFMNQIDDMIDELDDLKPEIDDYALELLNKMKYHNMDDLVYAAQDGDTRYFERSVKDLISMGFGDFDDDDSEEMKDLMYDIQRYSDEIIDAASSENIESQSDDVIDLLQTFKKKLREL